MVSTQHPVAEWVGRIRDSASRFPSKLPLPAEVERSRDQVLAAAAQRLAQEPLGVLSQGLNPSRFDSWSPGLRRKAYRHFPSTVEMVRELLHQALEPERSAATDELVAALAAEAATNPDPVALASKLPPAYIDRVCADNVFPLQLYGWLVARHDEETAERMRFLLSSLNERAVVGLRPLFQSLGLEPRPPLDWEGFTSVWMTVVEGTALRASVEGDDYDPELISWLTMALTIGMTRPIGTDDRDLPAVLSEHCSSAASRR